MRARVSCVTVPASTSSRSGSTARSSATVGRSWRSDPPSTGTRLGRTPVGLSAVYDHPELVITGSVHCGDVLNHLGDAVRRGESFVPGCSEFDVLGIRARIGSVHPDEWNSGRFAAWVDYYGALGPPRPEPSAVQVIWPDQRGRFPGEPGFDEDCPRMGDCQPLLHRAGGAPRPSYRGGGDAPPDDPGDDPGGTKRSGGGYCSRFARFTSRSPSSVRESSSTGAGASVSGHQPD